MKKLLCAALLSIFAIGAAYAAVDLNTANQAELEAVKGIGPAKAEAIISYREKNGGFKSVDELVKVKGFGKASVDKLKGQFEVSAAADQKN